MFLSVEKKPVQKVAAINEENKKITYGELQNFSKTFRNFIAERELIFIFCENDLGVLCAYISSMSNNVVPLLLSADIDQKLCLDLIKSYSPAYLWVPKRCISQVPYGDVVWETMDCVLVHTGLKSPRLNDELALLLTTSGSTGSPKLVRQSNYNIHSNAEAIIKYLDIRETDRPITSLPMNYTYGLSIVNSHLLAGATLLMTSKSILQKEFWSFFKEHGATSFAGVPYHYEMLNKIHFQSMDLPSLQTMTQAGGKLSLELSRIFATFAKNTGRRFFVMYGQTEATARMGYLPYQKALDK